METTNARVLSMNPAKRPTRAIRTPATAGPTIRAVLNDAEFMPTALTTCSRPTSSMMNDCRAG